MRLGNENDLLERKQAINVFSKLISEIVSDEVPLVFHGNNNIGIIHEIIRSGGLKTPDERQVEYSSFATKVDVTNKYDIHVSCEFAEPGLNSYMPYGAIFVFFPKDEERENVLKNSGSEVFGGVDGISFLEDRFIGIITTNENKSRIQTWLIENGLDASKVFNHNEFLEICKKDFSDDIEFKKI